MRTDLRALGDYGGVDMRDHAAARPHAIGGIGQENRGGRALPLRIGRRKKRPDVAFAQRAVDRVSERMQRRIRIRMPLQS